MKKLSLAIVAVAAIAAAAPASATVLGTYTPAGASTSSNGTLLQTFNSCTSTSCTGMSGTFSILTPPANSNGAPPASSNPAGTPYLSVLANNSATYTFASPVSAFQFDWGSIDTYNTLVVNYVGGSKTFVPGSTDFNNTVANGNQTSSQTNGLFRVFGTAGEQFTSVTFQNGNQNSFEVDNIAAVPEPATWAMMVLGFGAVGFAARRRSKVAGRVVAA
ncbi:hypothetical protein GGQ80_001390 [Sphingomonas jinjuensis]|uniref:Ice-binding protein C-terminal domain-containing protein n=1 Tax=Sphingomonas jinjuensis TaxID=535907 RepID=A0A840FHP2_9SPHN|nr:PEPxxWA-CTERM sorting domain-containing protein [Sphingomonas jinjuensis]MBB4153488.1 hypothetical protein [Sphingomonas jinjuensis]